MNNDCSHSLPTNVITALKLFNEKKFFEAHEELEDVWRDEKKPIRTLYQGVLQAAVVYFHITRGNYEGAVRMYERCMNLLNNYPDICRGIQIGILKNDLTAVIQEVQRLGAKRINEFNSALFKEVKWREA